MGLLGYEDEDVTSGLLQFGQLAGKKRPFLGLLAGLAAADKSQANRQDRASQERRLMLDEEMKRMQIAALQQAQAQQAAAQQRQLGEEEAYRRAYRSPDQVAMQLNGGPTRAASDAAPNLQPMIDQKALVDEMFKVNPVLAAQMLAPKQRKFEKVGDTLVDVTDGVKPVFTAPQKPEAAPSSVREFEYGQTNPAFNDWLERNNRAKGSTVNVNTAQNPFFSGVGAFGAKQFEASTAAAQEASKRIDQNKTILGVLENGNVYTGAGADIKLAAGKALQAVGINLDKDAIRNTELLATQLAQRTLANIRSSGLGAGNGFTNTDRDFLEKAVGGQIAITGDTLKRLAEMDNRAAMATIRKHNQMAQPVQKAAAMQGFPIDFSVPEPDMSGGWSIKREK